MEKPRFKRIGFDALPLNRSALATVLVSFTILALSGFLSFNFTDNSLGRGICVIIFGVVGFGSWAFRLWRAE